MAQRSAEQTSTAILLSNRFQYAGRRLLFARARLYKDRITFTGLGWTGWHRRTVPLVDVARIGWWTSPRKTVNFVLELHGGETLSMWLKGAGLWKYEVKKHAPNLLKDEIKREKVMAPAA